MKYLPTYRLEPKVPLNKEVCEKIIKTVMDKTFQDFVYAPKPALSLCAEVSEEIKNRVKNLNFDRYRYIVLVSIGEKLYQGYYSLVNFLWDPEKDGYLSYVYDTPKFFAVATLYYLYYD
ncbi:tctex1 domain-containing protein 1 [Glossina fuscipes]|uniref:Tctex1 domain-containing protein 1 n=1 Tax=Glossina fuscipes TaxID=7396 RepID=A0A9C5Z294_9MUSC|nr:tctex1 domain-containing protein 1 [Glossina fuscipes]